jgi:hypothetical protein
VTSVISPVRAPRRAPQIRPAASQKSGRHFGKTPVVRVSLSIIFPQKEAKNRETAFVSPVSISTIKMTRRSAQTTAVVRASLPTALQKEISRKDAMERRRNESVLIEAPAGATCFSARVARQKCAVSRRRHIRPIARCVLFPLRLCEKTLFQDERAITGAMVVHTSFRRHHPVQNPTR